MIKQLAKIIVKDSAFIKLLKLLSKLHNKILSGNTNLEV
jgi:hypothetical protein